MLFNSFEFGAFAIIVFLVVFLIGRFTKDVRIANVALLLASWYFYGTFSPAFLVILIGVTLVNYAAPLLMIRTPKRRKGILVSAVVLTLLPLLTYKYSIFLIDKVLGIHTIVDTNFASRLLLPVGISFYTFQALTYTIDSYRQKLQPTRSLLNVALFVSFFPTILSGPIEKARNLLPQIARPRQIDGDSLRSGLTTFIWGLFKKVAVADRIGAYVDMAYATAEYQTSGTLFLAAVLYSIQIYCDFSGYSDMAIGVARCLGFKLRPNFRFPYFSTSIKSFWRKWHISLTSWFTEYVYFSLGGNRVRLKARWVVNIALVFILSGIWHGAAWTFLVWGALHGVLYLVEHFLGLGGREYRHWWSRVLAGIVVFLGVTTAWIFFRADNFDQAAFIITRILSFDGISINPGDSSFTFAVNMALLLMFVAFEWKFYRDSASQEPTSAVCPPRGALWLSSVILMLGLFGVTSDSFVYFQF